MSVHRLISCALTNRITTEKLIISPLLPCLLNVLSQNDTLRRHSSHNSPLAQQRRYYAKKVDPKRKSDKSSSSSSTSSSSSDSDDDKWAKKKGKLGQSPFWKQKMRTHHLVIDINKDGVVSWDDFEVLIKNFSTLGNLPAKELEKFTDAMKHVWEAEWGASGDPYAFISQEQFLNNMEHAVNQSYLRKKIARPLLYFFNAVDWDSSGEISVEEFRTFFKCLGLSEQAADEAFAAIDINGDGTLSNKEFVRLGREFFLSEDENSPSKLFWGPLSQ